MSERELLEKETKKTLHAVLVSSRDGIPLNLLDRDYRRFVGRGIELRRLGYQSLREFLDQIPESVVMEEKEGGETMVKAAPLKCDEHITNLVAHQIEKDSQPESRGPRPRRVFSKPYVPAWHRRRILELLHAASTPVTTASFRGAYRDKFGEDLAPATLGFDSVLTMLSSVSNAVGLKESSSDGVIVTAKMTPSDLLHGLVDAKIRARLTELLNNVPEGITHDMLVDTYFKAYEEEMPYKNYGYVSPLEMLHDIPGLSLTRPDRTGPYVVRISDTTSSSSSPPLSVSALETLERLQSFLRASRGLRLRDLPRVFADSFGVVLDPRAMGCGSLEELVEKCADVCFLVEGVDGEKMIFASTSNSSKLTTPLGLAVDAVTEGNFRLAPTPPPEVLHDVEISLLNSPSDFWVNVSDRPGRPVTDWSVSRLRRQMNDFYGDGREASSQSALYRVPESLLRASLPVAAFRAGRWHRGLVGAVPSINYVRVTFVDVGVVDVVYRAHLRLLKREFFEEPTAALSCRLESVVPVDGQGWSRDCQDYFRSLTQSPDLKMLMHREEDRLLYVFLCISTGGDELWINDVLTDRKFATRVSPDGAAASSASPVPEVVSPAEGIGRGRRLVNVERTPPPSSPSPLNPSAPQLPVHSFGRGARLSSTLPALVCGRGRGIGVRRRHEAPSPAPPAAGARSGYASDDPRPRTPIADLPPAPTTMEKVVNWETVDSHFESEEEEAAMVEIRKWQPGASGGFGRGGGGVMVRDPADPAPTVERISSQFEDPLPAPQKEKLLPDAKTPAPPPKPSMAPPFSDGTIATTQSRDQSRQTLQSMQARQRQVAGDITKISPPIVRPDPHRQPLPPSMPAPSKLLQAAFNGHDSFGHRLSSGETSLYTSRADVVVDSHAPIMCSEARIVSANASALPTTVTTSIGRSRAFEPISKRYGRGFAAGRVAPPTASSASSGVVGMSAVPAGNGVEISRGRGNLGGGGGGGGFNVGSSDLQKMSEAQPKDASVFRATETIVVPPKPNQPAKGLSLWESLKEESLGGFARPKPAASKPQTSLGRGGVETAPPTKAPPASSSSIHYRSHESRASTSLVPTKIASQDGVVSKSSFFPQNVDPSKPSVSKFPSTQNRAVNGGGRSTFSTPSPFSSMRSVKGPAFPTGPSAVPVSSRSSSSAVPSKPLAAAASAPSPAPPNKVNSSGLSGGTGWDKLKMEAAGQNVPTRPNYNPKKPPLAQNFFKPETDDEKRDKLMDQIKALVRSQLLSAGKQGVEMDQFVSDYRSLMGDLPPFTKLGFKTLEDLLRSMPDVVTMLPDYAGYRLKAVVTQETARVASLIQYQKSSKGRSKKKRGGGGGGASGRFGGGGGRRFGGGGGGGFSHFYREVPRYR